MKTSSKEPGHELHAQVRAGFVLQRSSLYRWCQENGVCRPYADDALDGTRNGPKAVALRRRLMRAADVSA